MNSEGYNSDGPAKGGVGSRGWDDTITPADSITEIIQSSPYDRRAGKARALTNLLIGPAAASLAGAGMSQSWERLEQRSYGLLPASYVASGTLP